LIDFSFPLSFVWYICCLAENNLTSFDYAEGKFELVLGFDIECGCGGGGLHYAFG
jgi:NADH:ubiquinone oxidoreductase subunit H